MITFHKKSDLTKIEKELAKIAKFLSLDVPIEIDMEKSYINKEDDYELKVTVEDGKRIAMTISSAYIDNRRWLRCIILAYLFDGGMMDLAWGWTDE